MKLSAAIIFSLLFSNCINAQTCITCDANIPLNAGLVFCVDYNNQTTTDKINGFTASVINSPGFTVDHYLKPNSAVSFNGTNTLLRYGDILDSIFSKNPVATFSIAGWAKTNTISPIQGDNVIIAKSSGGAFGPYQWYIVHEFDGKVGGLVSYALASSVDFTEKKSPTVIPINTWFHFVLTYDGNAAAMVDRINFYVNTTTGVISRNAGPGGTTLNNTAQEVTVGGTYDPANQNPVNIYNGIVDDIRIYNRALTIAEVNTLYYGITPNIPHPPDITLCKNDSVTLKSGGGTSYLWTPSAGLNSTTDSIVRAKPAVSTQYIVAVESGSCTVYDTVQVNINNNCCKPALSVADPNLLKLYIPVQASADDYAPVPATTHLEGSTLLTTDRYGNLNSAYDFTNSLTDIIRVDTASKLSFDASTSFSVQAWVNPQSIRTTDSRILSLFSNNELALSYGGTLADPGKVKFLDFDSTTLTNTMLITSDSVLAPNQWSHLVLSINRTKPEATLYINGRRAGSSVGANSVLSNAGMSIGNHRNTGSGFNGLIDDVRIYNIALDSNQAYSLYRDDKIRILSNDTLLCDPGTVPIKTYGMATSFIWTPTVGLSNASSLNPFASPATTTKYKLTVNNGSCSSSDSINIIISNILPDAGIDGSICPGDSIQLTASGGLSYRWLMNPSLTDTSVNNPYAKPTVTEKYYVLVSDGYCEKMDSVTITVANALTTTAGPDLSMCFGDSVQLQATGGSSFSWQPATWLSQPDIADPKASPPATTTYIVTGTSGFCTGSDTVDVVVNPLPTIDAKPEYYTCYGLPILLDPIITNADQYSWNPTLYLSDPTSNNPVATVTSPVQFTITATNSVTGCINSDSMFVYLSKPNADFTVTPTYGNIPLEVITKNLSTPLSCTFSWLFDDTIPWNTSDFEPIYTYYFSGERFIRLIAFDSIGCSDTAWSSLISARDEVKIFIPNIITPNGDNLNDVFEIHYNPMQIKSMEGVIWDRWGAKAYEFSMPGGVWWNGKVDNIIAFDGVFVYEIVAFDIYNKKHKFKGNLTVLR